MARGDTKIVINSVTYDNNTNKILVGIRKNPETEDSQTAEVVMDNSDAAFSALNLRGLSAVISYDYGSGYVACPTLTVTEQVDITSGGRYQTVLSLIGIPDLLGEDKASVDYVHDSSDTKTVKDMLTEVLDGTAVATSLTITQDTNDAYYNMYGASINVVGQSLYIPKRTVTSIQFYLKKIGIPSGNITFYLRPVDESWLESKILGDAATISEGWYTATLDTPKYVDEQVHIYCEYVGGDVSNYIQIRYNTSAVLADENLGYRYAAGGWIYPDEDLRYKYSYTGTGIDCFTHCTSITATFDSEDALIDVYQPAGTFSISEGESRLSVVNRLLDYTASLKRVENDDEVHFFTTPASGNSYTSDKGQFYNHANKKTLVIPNKQTVKSYDDDDGYTGSATSAASYALKPIDATPVRAYVTGNAQAASVAAALIARYELNSQTGSGLLQMINSEQIWNYVTITNNWNSSTTTGNIAYLNRVSISGRFEIFLAFGTQFRQGLPGLSPKKDLRTEAELQDEMVLRWGTIKGIFGIIDENTDDIYEKLNLIRLILADMGADIDILERRNSDEWVYNTLTANLQLYLALAGGVMSGEIDMGSNKITSVTDPTANQEAATKKYVDDNAGQLSTTMDITSKAKDTVYQNTSGAPRLVLINCTVASSGGLAIVYVEAGDATPDVEIDRLENNSGGAIKLSVTFIVDDDSYYKLTDVSADTAVYKWVEWDLGS